MQTLFVLCLLTSAATPVELPSEDSVVEASATEVKPELLLVKRGGGGGGGAPLRGDMAWLLAGGAGALFSLLFFTVPVLFFAPGIAFFAPLFVAVIWALVVMGAAGVLVWFIQAYFSDMRSGILIPVLVSAGLGALITLCAGLVATLLYWTGALFNFTLYGYGYGWNPVDPNNYYYSRSRPFGFVAWIFSGLAWTVWVVGVIAAAIVAPLVGAWVYRRFGIAGDGRFHFDLMTPGRE
mgnify:CR=1 FL=1